MNPKRWRVDIEATGFPSVFDEFEWFDEDFADFIELAGPDWTTPGYKITITYNDPYNLREGETP